MKIADRNARIDALSKLCDEIEGNSGRAATIIQSILALAKGLAGLPASTFDVLALIAKRSLACARLLFEVPEADLASIHGLQEGLPFAWSLIPARQWRKAAELRYESILSALPDTFPARFELAATAIAARYQLIAAEEAAIAPLLGLAPPVSKLADVAQQFMQRSHDLADHFLASPFRPAIERRLPQWQFDSGYWRALDAPCAAALAASEAINLDQDQLRCVKDVARRHPKYFSEAFIATFKEHPVG
jgi:hypothetical protein